MRNSRKIKTSETLETVRERERERELYSKEIGFINYAKKLVKINNKNNRIKSKNIKGGLCAKIGM